MKRGAPSLDHHHQRAVETAPYSKPNPNTQPLQVEGYPLPLLLFPLTSALGHLETHDLWYDSQEIEVPPSPKYALPRDLLPLLMP